MTDYQSNFGQIADPASVAPAPEARPERRSGPTPTTALLALAPDTASKQLLPRLEDALWRAERIHAALVRLSDRQNRGPSRCFTGKDDAGKPLSGHRHAMVLPLSLARPGHIDHVLIHAPMGLDEAACTALETIRAMWATANEPEMLVTLVRLGAADDFGQLVPHVRAADIWTSTTPFVAPRFLKAKGSSSLEGQVQAELASRGLPAATRVEVQLEGGGHCEGEGFWQTWQKQAGAGTAAMLSQRWRQFRLERGDKRTPEQRKNGVKGNSPPIAVGVGLRVTFEKPVTGPIALGYGAHFGLGMMAPSSRGECDTFAAARDEPCAW